MKPFIKQKRFYKPSSALNKPGVSCPTGELPLPFLNRPSAFETLRAFDGVLFRWEEHWARLKDSAAALSQRLPMGSAQTKRWLELCLRESGQPNASLRLSVHWSPEADSEMVLLLKPFLAHPEAWYEKGVAVHTAVSKRWTLKAQDPQIKVSQYVSGVLATLDRGERQSHELVFLSSGGMVAEGSVSNLFIVKKKCLLTPSVGSGILKGVTRGIVIALAKKRRIPVRETVLTRHDFYSADECFLTNTSSEVLPVVQMDGRKIGHGVPGPIAKLLKQDFLKLR